MALQDIINSAVNVEVNRSKLVAQTVSRSGRISVASRNWANPFRFVVTPKPVWTAAEYRAVFEPLFDRDRYEVHGIQLNTTNTSTGVATLGNSWMVNYQGGGDANGNNVIDSYQATSATGTRIILSNINSTTITAGTFLVKAGDYVIPFGSRYPYIATSDVIIPTAFSGRVGTIRVAGTSTNIIENNTYVNFTATATRTTVTLTVGTTTGLSVGQLLTKTAGDGAFGGVTYIDSIISSTVFIIVSTTDCTAPVGNTITFDGTGPTSTPTVAIPIHRGYLQPFSSGSISLYVGARAANFNVIVTKLPQIRYLPGKLIELTSDLELIEEIL
jgi:hypothetical protein